METVVETTMETAIKIRALQVKDVFTVARMLGKITKGARQELTAVLKGEKKKGDKKPDPTELGMVLFQSLVTEAEGDIKAWMADLIGKEVVEFDQMPATAVLDVIDGLARQEDIRSFFAKASVLANQLTGMA